MKLIECPNCTNIYGEPNTLVYRKERYTGTNDFTIDTKDDNTEDFNYDMYSNAKHKHGKWWYCSMCNKRLAKVDEE